MKAITWKVHYTHPALCILLGVVTAGSYRVIRGQATPSQTTILARGAGTSILEGGTGAPDYLPVLTKVAFHAELLDGVVTGDFECLALGPRKSAGATSADFTSIGAGENVPFTVEIRKGGPGATVVLRAGNPPQTFREILTSGNFEIAAAQ